MNRLFTSGNTTANTRNAFLRRIMILFAGVIFFVSNSYGQIPVTVTNPGNATPALDASYTSFGDALTAINAITSMSGPITLNLGAGSETAPAKGFELGSADFNGATSSTNTLTILGQGAATILNAGEGDALPNTGSQDGILKLIGADWITIDGLTLVDGNATNPATMEFGIGLYKRSATDGCNNNTIRNCNITMNRINNTTASTTASGYGAKGIVIANALATTMNSILTVTSADGSSSNNKIYNNTIQNCHIGISVISYGGSTPYPYSDYGNDIGGNSPATGNTILNFGSPGSTVYAAGIYTYNQRDLNIAYNNINSNDGNGSGHAHAIRGIYTTTATNANLSITHNTVRIHGAGTTSTHNVTGIENTSGASGTDNTVTISHNTIENCIAGDGTGTTIAFEGIYHSASAWNLVIDNNTITNNVRTGTTGTSYLLYTSGPINRYITNNTVTNNIHNFQSGTMYCLYGLTGTGGITTISNNTVANNQMVGGSGSSAATMYVTYHSTSPVEEHMDNNLIYNNVINTSTTSATNLIYSLYSNSTANAVKTIKGNTIFGNAITGGPAGGTVLGIYNLAGTSTEIAHNKVYDLTAEGAAGRVTGINSNSGTDVYIYNNLIGNLNAPQASGSTTPTSPTTGAGVFGISTFAGTSVYLYNNTVRLDAVSSGSELYTAALMTDVDVNVTAQNNIFVNLSDPGANGLTAAYWRSSTDFSLYSTESNNNLYYAGVPGPNRVVLNGSNGIAEDLITFKALVAPADGNSIRENPNFLSTTGSSADFLHINPAIPSQLEGGGLPVALVTTDFDGDPRDPSTPDIGADEFNGTPLAVVSLNSISIDPPGSLCTALPRTITANTTAGGTDITSVSIAYSVNGGPINLIPMTGGTAGSGTTSDWTGVIPVPTPSNARIDWGVVAIDELTSRVLNGDPYEDEQMLGASIIIEADPNPACSGSDVILTATPIVAKTPVLINEYTTTNSSYVSPFYALNGNKHLQLLYPVDELVAAGLRPGALSALSFYCTTVDAIDKNENFTVRLAHTTQIDMAAFVTTGLQEVYSTETFIPVGNSENVITFQNEFVWDGTSHIVVDICFGNPSSTALISNTTRVTNTSYISAIKTHNTSATHGSAACSDFASNLLTYTIKPQITFYGYGPSALPNYSWSDGSGTVGSTNPLVVNPVADTDYTVTGSNEFGCSVVSVPYTVTTIALPNAPIGAGSTQCGEGVPGAFVVTGFTSGSVNDFRWYDAPTGGNLLQTGGSLYTGVITETTTFYVSEFDGSCESPRTAITATVNPPDAVTAVVNDAEICLGETATLTITQDGNDQNYSFTWTAEPEAGSGITGSLIGAPVTGQVEVIPTEVGTYVYTVAANDGACNTSSTIEVTVNHLPFIYTISATPDTLCAGGTSELEVSTLFGLPNEVQIGSGTSTTTTYTPFYGSTAGRKVQYIFTADELLALGVEPGPISSFAVEVTTTGTIGPLDLNVSMGHTTQTTTVTTFVTGLDLVYTGTYMPETGWSAVEFTTPFNWNGVDNVVLEVCHTGNTTTGKVAASCRYYTPGGGTKTTYSTNAAGCGQATGTTSSLRPLFRFGAIVGTVTTADHNFVWNPGGLSGNTTMVSPATTTTYTVTATHNVTGCSSNETIEVVINPLPPAPTANSSSHCGDILPLATVASNSGATTPIFNWYDAPTGGNLLQSGPEASYQNLITETTTWYVSEVSEFGCEGDRVALTEVVSVPDPVIAESDLNNVCPGVPITLTATQDGFNNFYDFSWTAVPETGSGITGMEFGNPVIVTPTVSGTYQYIVTANDLFAGCIAVDTVDVTIAPTPIISDVTATPQTSCSGSPVELEVFSKNGPPLQHKVGTGTNSFSGAGNPYWRGVSAEALKSQFFYPATLLTGAGLTPNQLISGIGFIIATNTANPPFFKNYTISIGHTTATGLTSTWETGLQVAKLPHDHIPEIGLNMYNFENPFVWNGVDNIVVQVCYDNDVDDSCPDCYGGSVAVEYTTGGGFTGAAYYYESFDDHAGGIRNICAYSGSASTQGHMVNAVFLGEPDNDTQLYDWVWSPAGGTTPVTTVNPTTTTTYTVTATDPVNGCVNEGTVEVTVLDLPNPPIANNSSHCGFAVPTASVSTGGSNGTYRWYDAETGGTLLQDGGSTYTGLIGVTTTLWVSESDDDCESLRTPVTITVIQPDPVDATLSDNEICLGESTVLTAVQTGSNQNYSYTWNADPETGSGIVNGAAGNGLNITPTAAGSYTYEVTAFDPVGPCTIINTVSLLVNPNPDIVEAYVSPAEICNGETATLIGSSSTFQLVETTLGDSTAQLSTTGSPYRSGAGANSQIKTQLLVHASELQALGLTAGSITALGFNTDLSSGTFINWEIRLGHTAATALTTTFLTDPLELVHTEASFTPPSHGTTLHEFQTPFAWDGVSNLLIETRQTNNITGTARVASHNPGFTANVQSSGTSGFAATTGSTSTTRPMMYLRATTGQDLTDNYVWTWNPGAMAGPEVDVSPSVNSSYTVTAVNPLTGCNSTSESVNLTVYEVPAPVTPNHSVQCGLAIPEASVTGSGGTFIWYDSPVDGNVVQTGGSTFAGEISETTTWYIAESNGNCESERVALTATVIEPDAVTAETSSAAICPGANITLTAVQTGSTQNYVYTWSADPEAGSGITGTVNGQVQNIAPSIPGTYTYNVLAVDDDLGCVTASSVEVTVNPIPFISDAFATQSVICSGGSTTLVAQSIMDLPGDVTIGTGTSTTTTYSPFRAGSAVSRFQYLFTADELAAAGIGAGPISSISFDVTSTGTNLGPIQGFSVKMAHSNITEMTANYEEPGFTDVFVEDYHPVTGLNTLVFSTPFMYDGVSGIIINTCHGTQSPLGTSASVRYGSAGTGNYRTIYSTSAPGCTDDAGTRSVQRPNITFNAIIPQNITDTYNWVWNPGNVAGDSAVVNPLVNTVYTATATNPLTGCTAESASVMITIESVGANATASQTTICAGDETILHSNPTGGAPFTFSWSDGTNVIGDTETLAVSPATTTTYTVTVTDACNVSTQSSIQIVVNQLPTAAIDQTSPVTVCQPETTTLLTTTTDATAPMYQWVKDGFDIPGADDATYLATETGVYSVRISETGTGCMATSGTVDVFFRFAPTDVVVTPSAASMCADAPALELMASGAEPTQAVVGEGTIVNAINSSTNIPPYGNTWVANRHQMLIRATELTAAGVSPGPITSLAFEVVSNNNPLDLMNFTIKLGNTSATALTTTFLTDPTTEVWSAALFNPTTGWSTHYFSTPFIWDGTSNLLVETHFSNCTMGTSTCNVSDCDGASEKGIAWYENAVVRQSNTSYVSHVVFVSDDVNACGTAYSTIPTANNSFSVRPNMRFGTFTSDIAFTWSPLDGLYTDAAATVPYTGTPVATVYAKPDADQTYEATATTAFGCTASATADITVAPALVVSNEITGPTNPGAHVGNGSPLATYVITADNYTNIVWDIPAGALNVDGQGTTSISFNYPVGYTVGTISVTVDGQSPCASIVRTLNIACDAPEAPVVSGPKNVCTYIGTGIPVTYTITPDPTVSSYTWTLPPNVNVVSGLGTGELTLTFNNAFLTQGNKQLRVRAVNGCGISTMSIYYLVAQLPASLGQISGPNDACGFVGTANEAVYTVAEVDQAESYNWTVPAGATIESGQGTNTIAVTFDGSYATGAISVNATNNCGTSNTRSIVVTRTLPLTPGLIAGSTNVCMFMPSAANPAGVPVTYSVVRSGDNTYDWTLPAGVNLLSQQQTATHDEIEVLFTGAFAGGQISVVATNNCGTSATPRTLALSMLNPGTPSAIDVVNLQSCPNRQFTYTLTTMPANATSVVWTVPAGGTILSGQGTQSITVEYDGSGIAGNVTATANNGCGNSATRKVAVKLPVCPPAERTKDLPITKFTPEEGTDITTDHLEVTVFPNPSVHNFKLQARSGDKTGKIQVRLLDNLGREYKRYTMMPGETLQLGAELKAGTYFVEVMQGRERVTKRVIKQ